MSYKIAGIDVHKKILAVVVSDVEVDGEYQFEQPALQFPIPLAATTIANASRWIRSVDCAAAFLG
jgi:hypothetical protein